MKILISLALGLSLEPEDEKKQCDRVFRVFDHNKDGVISQREFEDAALNNYQYFHQECNWGDILKAIDLDGDGRCDYHEFCAASIDHRLLLTKQNLRMIFTTLDANNDQMISVADVMKQLPTNMQQGKQLKIRNVEQGPFFQTNDELMTDKQKKAQIANWNKIFHTVDLNKDGLIDFNETCAEVKKYLDDYPDPFARESFATSMIIN